MQSLVVKDADLYEAAKKWDGRSWYPQQKNRKKKRTEIAKVENDLSQKLKANEGLLSGEEHPK